MQRYANYVVYTWKNWMPGKPDKTSHFSAYLGNLGGEIFMIRILFVCHGRNRAFVWNGLKSRILGNENGICTPIVPLFWYFTDLLTGLPSKKWIWFVVKEVPAGTFFTYIEMSVWMSVKCRFVYDVWLQYILCDCTINNNRIPYLRCIEINLITMK